MRRIAKISESGEVWVGQKAGCGRPSVPVFALRSTRGAAAWSRHPPAPCAGKKARHSADKYCSRVELGCSGPFRRGGRIRGLGEESVGRERVADGVLCQRYKKGRPRHRKRRRILLRSVTPSRDIVVPIGEEEKTEKAGALMPPLWVVVERKRSGQPPFNVLSVEPHKGATK